MSSKPKPAEDRIAELEQRVDKLEKCIVRGEAFARSAYPAPKD